MKKFWEKIGTTEIRNILAVISVVGSFIVLYFLIIKPIPGENKETVNLALGFTLGSLVAGVNGFYFGASKADKENPKS